MPTKLELFTTVYDETVEKNKLSSSVVEETVELSEACLETPAALTAALLKSHSKASPSTSLSSFYLFDAIARNTLGLAKKGAKSSRPERQERGKIAQAWLDNAAGVADDIAAITFAQVAPPRQEKVKKVVDIWIKSGAFREEALAGIQELIRSTPSSSTSKDEREVRTQQSNEGGSPVSITMAAPPIVPSPLSPPAPAGLPSSLAALLGAAAPAPTASHTVTNSAVVPAPAAHSTSALLSSLSHLIQQPSTITPAPADSTSSPPFPSASNGGSNGRWPAQSSGDSGYEVTRPRQTSSSDQLYRSTISSSSHPLQGSPSETRSGWSGDHRSPMQGSAHHVSARGAATGYAAGPQPGYPSGDAKPSALRRSASPPSKSRNWDSQTNRDGGAQGSAETLHQPPQPEPDPTVGDLSGFDMSSFDPSDPKYLDRLGKMYQNTFGHYPSGPEMTMMLTMIMTGGAAMMMGGMNGPELSQDNAQNSGQWNSGGSGGAWGGDSQWENQNQGAPGSYDNRKW